MPGVFLLLMAFQFNLISMARSDIAFWGFFTFNLAIYSYFGQAFMCLVRGMGTAQILASVFIGINNFFSGLIVRPQFLSGVFQFTYWITPVSRSYFGSIFWNEIEISRRLSVFGSRAIMCLKV